MQCYIIFLANLLPEVHKFCYMPTPKRAQTQGNTN